MPSNAATTYRLGRPEDVPAIHAIFREARLSVPLPTDRERLTRSTIGEIFTAVCQQGAEVIGVLQWRNLGDELEILDLAVARKHRRAGHAAFLLENFLPEAAQTGAHCIFLEVRESNTPAIALYTKFGFTRAGRRPSYYRDPVESALLMQRSLPKVEQG
jgi:[ribosomal protein S18]-alanine N-acetyltransferase